MRIVLVTPFYPAHGGGVELVAARLAREMTAAGDAIVWCASDTDEPPRLCGVVCEPMSGLNVVEQFTGMPYPLWSPAAASRLARHIRAAEAVHLHDCIYMGSLLAARAARRHGKKLVVTQHIGERPLPWALRKVFDAVRRLGTAQVLAGADGVAFISPQVQRQFESLGGARPHYRYMPNGVDTEIFGPGSSSPEAGRAALGFDPNRPLMLFVGRFVPVKRLPLLREMAASRPDWQWCVIGQGPERPEAWGLANVRVLPPLSQAELAPYYRSADLLVLPSQSEGFPLVVQESMACGTPACFTAGVAGGASMPRELWLELPEVPGETARRGIEAIDNWLSSPAEVRRKQRVACAQFARRQWRWEVAAQAHRAMLLGTSA